VSDESKSSLRNSLRAIRVSLPEGLRRLRGGAILEKLKSRPEYRNASNLALTHSVGSEVDTVSLIEERLREGQKVLLPIAGPEGRMDFHEVTTPLEKLLPSNYGIPEPDPRLHPLVTPDRIDLIVVPGVGFDPWGNRLGLAGGYFDRYLPRLPQEVPILGLAYECQMIEKVPHEAHDRPVDAVITERTVYRVQKKEWTSQSVEETHRLAAEIAARLSPPLLIRLSGNLGAGKTEWVRGALQALGWQTTVKSPTFTLENVYDLGERGRVVHLDGYRLDSPSELDANWIGEILEDPETLVLVEWPERFGNALPFSSPSIGIDRTGEQERRFRWTAFEEEDRL